MVASRESKVLADAADRGGWPTCSTGCSPRCRGGGVRVGERRSSPGGAGRSLGLGEPHAISAMHGRGWPTCSTGCSPRCRGGGVRVGERRSSPGGAGRSMPPSMDDIHLGGFEERSTSWLTSDTVTPSRWRSCSFASPDLRPMPGMPMPPSMDDIHLGGFEERSTSWLTSDTVTPSRWRFPTGRYRPGSRWSYTPAPPSAPSASRFSGSAEHRVFGNDTTAPSSGLLHPDGSLSTGIPVELHASTTIGPVSLPIFGFGGAPRPRSPARARRRSDGVRAAEALITAGRNRIVKSLQAGRGCRGPGRSGSGIGRGLRLAPGVEVTVFERPRR